MSQSRRADSLPPIPVQCPSCKQLIGKAVLDSDDPHAIDCELRPYDARETRELRQIYTGGTALPTNSRRGETDRDHEY